MKALSSVCIFLSAAFLCSADVVNLYFAGGEINANSTWTDAIKAELTTYAANVEVVHAVHAGSAISQWYTTSAQANYEADFFNGSGTGALESRIAQIEANGDEAAFKGLFWFQGESDTASTNTMDAYAGRFNGMLAELKSDLGLTNDIDFTIALIDLNSDSHYDDPANADGRSRGDIAYMRSVQSNLCAGAHGALEDSRGYARTNAWELAIDPDLIDFGTAMAHTHLETFSCITTTNTLILGSHGADGGIINNTIDAGQNLIGARTSGNNCNGICFFRIPDGKVLDAELTFTVDVFTGVLPTGYNVDIWALGYQSVPLMNASWRYEGDADTRLLLNGAAPVKIADNFIAAGQEAPADSVWSLSESEGAALAEYINNIKANGAVAGDYIVLRINPDALLSVNAGTRFGASDDTGREPVLTLLVEQQNLPEQRTQENGYWRAVSHSADGAISESGIEFSTQTLISSTGGSGNEPWNGICFFELPPQPLVDADMELTVVDVRGWGSQPINIDLWGLGYQSSPGMATNWYVSADSDTRTLLNGAKPVKIADNIASAGNTYSVGYRWSPNDTQKVNLKNFINHLFELGARPRSGVNPGDYAVFRVNMDSRVSGILYGLRWGSSSETGSEPVFNGTFTPGENRLLNPDMEDGTSVSLGSWGVQLNNFQYGQTNLFPRNGNFCARLGVGANQTSNTANNVNFSQSVSRDDWGGKYVNFSCYARQDPNDPMVAGSAQKVEARIYYYGEGGASYGFITSDAATDLLPSDPVDDYKYVCISGVAPAGTIKITAQVIFRTGTPCLPPNDPITGGAVLVDDARLEIFEALPPAIPKGTIVIVR